jgi:hypothetical protein
MELSELDNLLKIYETKIKPFIEKGEYDKAGTYVSGLASRLLEEQMRENLTMNFSAYLPNVLASSTILVDFLKEKNVHGIERENMILDMNLKQYKMRLEALAKE